MISEQEFLDTELSVGISPSNPQFVELAKQTADAVIRQCDFTTVLDYGAGVGVYSNEMSKLGKEVFVYEIFKPHREFIQANFPHLPMIEEPKTTDLLMWIEVAEHMTDVEHAYLFSKIQPKYVLFSSTSESTPQDEDWGHINIKEQSDWIEMFNKFGYKLKSDMSLPTQWTKLFERI